jgi:ABC-type multidrug transport system fused ATPase/permease subunit
MRRHAARPESHGLHTAGAWHAGARQTAKLRQKYLRAALLQDISYYDVTMTSGDVLSGLNEDCTAVQNAVSDKVGNVLHHMTTAVVAVGIALWRGWKLALVMIALMPLIAFAGGILAKLLAWGTSRRSEAYAKANVMSSQAIQNVRTVQSFQAEPRIFSTYAALLDLPRSISVRLATYSGFAQGSVNLVVFIACAPPPHLAVPLEADACSCLWCPACMSLLSTVAGWLMQCGRAWRHCASACIAPQRALFACVHCTLAHIVHPPHAHPDFAMPPSRLESLHTCRYGIAFLYGHQLVREADYTAGKVMNVIFAAIIAGFSLGQAAPNFQAFAGGRAAGFRLRRVLDRTPGINVDAPGLVPPEPLTVRCSLLSAPHLCCHAACCVYHNCTLCVVQLCGSSDWQKLCLSWGTAAAGST